MLGQIVGLPSPLLRLWYLQGGGSLFFASAKTRWPLSFARTGVGRITFKPASLGENFLSGGPIKVRPVLLLLRNYNDINRKNF